MNELTDEGEPRYVEVVNTETGDRRPARLEEDGVIRDGAGPFDEAVWDIVSGFSQKT